MLVDNIFKLVNKFSKEEDQLSANFGFMLKNDKEILKSFFKKLRVSVRPGELKQIDIETQVPYDSGKSRIDLQIIIPNKLLIFLESKIASTKVAAVYEQLKKYREILMARKSEYGGIRLVYVGKLPLSEGEINALRRKLKLKPGEFLFFSWEDLLNLARVSRKKELVNLFNSYIGDSMHNKKIIHEQKLKKVVDVLVVFTNPAFWEMTCKKNIAVQGNSAPDAHYIAFLRIGLPERKRSAITHIAEVEYTEINVPLKTMFVGLPIETKRALVQHLKSREIDLARTHKHYVLKKGSLVPLAREIIHDSNKGMLYFRTTMKELLRVKTTRGIKVG